MHVAAGLGACRPMQIKPPSLSSLLDRCSKKVEMKPERAAGWLAAWIIGWQIISCLSCPRSDNLPASGHHAAAVVVMRNQLSCTCVVCPVVSPRVVSVSVQVL